MLKNCWLGRLIHNAQEFENSNFQLTLNDPTSIIENAISLELGLYCSNHYRENCRCTVAATETPGVLQPPPLTEISSRDYEGGEVLGNKEQSREPLLWSWRNEGRHHLFLNSRVRIIPTINEDLQTGTSFSVGSAMTTTAWWMDEWRLHGVTCETTKTRVDDNQDIKRCTWSE
jgi:hypothetical protein